MMATYTPDPVFMKAYAKDWYELMLTSKADPKFMRGFRQWKRTRRHLQTDDGAAK
jgi:hypothetical protein